MSSIQYGNFSLYNTHNLYGISEQIATRNALIEITNKRPFLLSRSSFVGSGVYTAKWTGDNKASWDDLKSSIISIMDFNIFGIPMIGADICGFNDPTNEELCARWIEVGAFYPFSRNHNSIGNPPQELYLWKSVTEASKNALGIRYQLLPYIYTLFYAAHVSGGVVIAPVFFNFASDAAASEIDDQFMIGESILISPVLQQGQTVVDAYFPQQFWYRFTDLALEIDASSGGRVVSLPTALTQVNVHIRGGSIIPLQQVHFYSFCFYFR
jgi:alpha-glucosidase